MRPVVDLNAKPAQPTTTATTAPTIGQDNIVPIAVGGALALLAIGGVAMALSRRRRRDEEEWVEDDSIEHEPMAVADEPVPETVIHEEQPTILAPPVSAFSWGNDERATEGARESMVDQDDRESGESWVQRAYRGPSPLNPSVSLKTRLRRAAFFDKRERDAAAGLAAHVDPRAGLPDRMHDQDQRQDELA